MIVYSSINMNINIINSSHVGNEMVHTATQVSAGREGSLDFDFHEKKSKVGETISQNRHRQTDRHDLYIIRSNKAKHEKYKKSTWYIYTKDYCVVYMKPPPPPVCLWGGKNTETYFQIQ